jgi:hypothetical protein
VHRRHVLQKDVRVNAGHGLHLRNRYAVIMTQSGDLIRLVPRSLPHGSMCTSRPNVRRHVDYQQRRECRLRGHGMHPNTVLYASTDHVWGGGGHVHIRCVPSLTQGGDMKSYFTSTQPLRKFTGLWRAPPPLGWLPHRLSL